MNQRINTISRLAEEEDVDAVLLTHLPDVRWACGFSGSNGLLIVQAGADRGDVRADFVTDGRYDEQAQQEVQGAEVHVYSDKMWGYVEENDLLAGLDALGFQSDHVTVSRLASLEERFDAVDWTPVTSFLTRTVAQKDDAEIRQITAAQRITEAVFDTVRDRLKPGVTEKEIAAEVVYEHLRRGADKMSFDPIVAAGPNAAKPHARPTDRPIQEGEMVVLDMGCFAEGYASDMTRTVAVGEPGEAARRGYAVVLDAQQAALDAARAGMTGKELDAVAREVIDDAGLEEYFSHSLGHGVGLQIHEWPRVSRTSDYELPPGACVTIEPGVYVPEQEYGVRIEDLVVLREDGCDNLTRTPKELVVID